MRSFRKLTGEAIGRAAMLLLGVLGGIVWAALICLSLIYLFRAGYIGVWLAASLAVFAFAVLVPAGLLRPGHFMRYAVPVLLILLGGDDTRVPVRPCMAMVAGFVALVLLGVSAATVSGAAFCIGMAAASAYWILARGVAEDMDRESQDAPRQAASVSPCQQGGCSLKDNGAARQEPGNKAGTGVNGAEG